MNYFLNKFLSVILLLVIMSVLACKQKPATISEEDYSERKKQFVEVNKILVQKDQQRIKGYIERQNLDMLETETGLWYGIDLKGEGPKALEGNIIILDYTLSLLDGTVCYSSAKNGVKSFRIGRGGVESGLEEAVLLLNEGDKAKFILPPYLAYGLTGDGDKIPARATIVYDLEVLSIE